MKDDEKRFLKDLFASGGTKPRQIITTQDFYIPQKRALYLLKKWSGKDWYDYGVTIDMGWLTENGKEIAKSLT